MLRFQGGEYVVTDEDRLWLLRAVQAEGEPRQAVAQALVNGFAWARANGRWKASLMGWVRAYAQPVNSRWFTSGDKFLLSVQGRSPADVAAMKKRAYQREAMHSTRTQFTAETESAVNYALTTVFHSDITDYAAHDHTPPAHYVARSAPKAGVNRFWTRAVGWTGYIADGWSSASGGAGIALALLVGVWLLAKRGG